jgi:hypothetical protein
MNVISYINGDAKITDFPACSARPLALLVQACNDLLAGADGYLSPEKSVLALELAWRTAGTADVGDAVVHAWLAELLTNRNWGIVQYARISVIKAIADIAELHRQAAYGVIPTTAAWDAADHAVRTAARAMNPATNPASSYAMRAALEATALVGNPLPPGTLDAVTAYALRAHALAHSTDRTSHTVEFTRQAIRCWRDLSGIAASTGQLLSKSDTKCENIEGPVYLVSNPAASSRDHDAASDRSTGLDRCGKFGPCRLIVARS